MCYFIQTVPLNNQPSHVTQGDSDQLKVEMSNAIFSYFSLKMKLFQCMDTRGAGALEFSRVVR